ncbi:Vga family ABC-F type ribosomal protection protein [Evansella clarkii]|uniref:Vga family ABC-F type ribosomal protection protein n=1 Tax=Evansella clarkii TaxID=79879 RepID=UPI000B4510B5|nr:Vga family ABC-F type ribosomal protection protein [Evansella clarkii]
MILLEALQIKHYVKDRLLLDIGQLQIHKNDRIGLVGKNGSGKTTLMNILTGRLDPEEGTVDPHVQTELLPQLKREDSVKSGGEVTQEYINQAFIKAPELLFADEPTTHLDTEHIEWLEKKLSQWDGAFVVVSHDREFLDTLCNSIWEISEGKIKEYKGNYSDYQQQKELELAQKKSELDKYEQKKRQMEQALQLKEKKAARATKTPKKVSKSEAKITGAKPYFANKQKKLQKTAKALETRLEKLEKPENVKETAPLKMNLPNEESFKGRIVMRAEDMSGSAGKRVLWTKTSFQVRGGDKLAIIGPNGAGKTTLVKKIVYGGNGIKLSPAVKTGYFAQNLSIIDVEKSILENVSASSKYDETFIRTVLARLHFFREDVHKPAGVLSGGERVKTALAKLFLSDVNTLVLDEPTNFLDIEAAAALETLLREYEGTVIFVTHDRRFIENLASRVLIMGDGKIELFEGTYEQFKNKGIQQERDSAAEKLLILETKISDVLSRLSIDPNEELEKEFQQLMEEKKKLKK